MNYYEARPLKDGRGGHWTGLNDGQIWPAGACGEHAPHSTKEEAERCFYEYETASLVERTWASAHRCEVEGCGVWADKSLGPRGGSLAGSYLCDAHRTPETWRSLHPFEPGGSIMSSW